MYGLWFVCGLPLIPLSFPLSFPSHSPSRFPCPSHHHLPFPLSHSHPSTPPRIVRLVRALRKGWIKADDLQQQQPGDALLGEGHDETPPLYLMWADDGQVSERVANGLTYLAPPRMQLPGHEESYNPPPEYLPTDVRGGFGGGGGGGCMVGGVYK